MPRNSSGTYTLPAGNPVVTGTTISSTWANTTLSDIGSEITDSLDRSGKGGMLAALQLFSGVVGAPGLSWTTETTSGLYRAGAGDFRYSISSTDKLQLTTNGLRTTDGAAATPSLSFISDTDTGLYSSASNQISAALGGVETLRIAGNYLAYLGSAGIGMPNGTALAPSYTFNTDSDTGLYIAGANTLGFAAGSAQVGTWSTTVFAVGGTLQIRAGDGSAGTPTYSFSNDTDTGVYRAGANIVVIAAGGVASTVFTTQGTGSNIDGSAGSPSFYWNADTDTGFFRQASNVISIALGASETYRFASGALTSGSAVANMADGTAGAPAYSFNSDPDTGVYRSSTNFLALSAGGSAYISFGDPAGVNSITIGLNSTTAWVVNSATSGSATGGAATLPANPVSFLSLTINGTARKIPFYAT